MSGLYHCLQCALPPLHWRAGEGLCYKHAVEFGLLPADKTYVAFDETTVAEFGALRKPKHKITLADKMARLTRTLIAEGNWEEGPQGYNADLFSEQRVEHEEITELNLPYRSLSGELKSLPF